MDVAEISAATMRMANTCKGEGRFTYACAALETIFSAAGCERRAVAVEVPGGEADLDPAFDRGVRLRRRSALLLTWQEHATSRSRAWRVCVRREVTRRAAGRVEVELTFVTPLALADSDDRRLAMTALPFLAGAVAAEGRRSRRE